MKSTKLQLCASAAVLAVSLSLAVDWLLGPWLGSNRPAVRWSMFAANLALAAAAARYAWGRFCATRQAILCELELLCRTNLTEIAAGPVGTTIPSLAEDSVWAQALGKLRDRMAATGRQLEHLEQQRLADERRVRGYESHGRRINAILSGLAEPVLAIDKHDHLMLANPSADQLFAIDHSQVEGRVLAELIRCEKLVDLLQEARQRKTPKQHSCEIEIARQDGPAQWFRVTARSIPAKGDPSDSDGGSHGAVAVLHDISLQKAVQKRSAEFIAAVSHEMKTPLAGIKAYVELLVDGDAEDEETQKEFLEVIAAQASRLQRLVDNLLNLARIEAGVMRANKQERSLNDLLEEAAKITQPAAAAKNITLRGDLSPEYLEVLVDRDMALQAITNLLSNAVKFTPRGGQITLRSRPAGNEVRFDVEDTGVGLSGEDCGKVFEKFYRVQKDKDMAPGTGLGLPLVKHIVEDVHGGRIEVHSVPERGSVFSVFWPRATVNGPEKPRACVGDACSRAENET